MCRSVWTFRTFLSVWPVTPILFRCLVDAPTNPLQRSFELCQDDCRAMTDQRMMSGWRLVAMIAVGNLSCWSRSTLRFWSLQLYDVVGPSSLSDKVDRLPCWWSALPGCFHPSDLRDLCQLLQDFVGQVVAPPVPTLGQCWFAERQRCASTCRPNLWSCCSIMPRSSSILAGLG